VEPVDEKLRIYKSNWLRHIKRINSTRMSKIVLIMDQMGEDDLEDLRRDYLTRPKPVYQGLTCDG
jgi:hypothetical protein